MMIQLMGSITKEIKKLLKKFKSKPMKGAADVAAIVILLVSLIVFIAVLPALNETICSASGIKRNDRNRIRLYRFNDEYLVTTDPLYDGLADAVNTDKLGV